MSDEVTVEETRPPREVPWYSIDEWSLRRKLALALALPVILALMFGGMRIVRATSEASTFGRFEAQATVIQPAVAMLQNASAVAVASRGTDSAELGRERTALTDSVKSLQTAMNDADLSEDQIRQLRSSITAAEDLLEQPPGGGTAVVDLITDLEAATDGVSTMLTGLASDASDTRLAAVGNIVGGQVALTAQRLIASQPTEERSPYLLGQAIGEEKRSIAGLRSTLGSSNSFVVALDQANQLRLENAEEVVGGAPLLAAQDVSRTYTNLSNTVTGDSVRAMGERASEARKVALRDGLLTILLLGAGLGLAAAVSRMLLEPIRKVREGALSLAQDKLPEALARIRAGEEPPAFEPLPVHTREEMGQMARAVDTLHAEAIHLATEQAHLRSQVTAMFETLSRRSTSLINQQLGVIESLERDEQDPRRLESLFRLDHLAARIRRNGESLLVLAGAAPRGSAGQYITLGDVMRAAISQVQDYQRVQLGVPDLPVQASVAPNLIHLFAELVDNALVYSPPDRPVIVRTSRSVDGGVLVEIADHGLGMTADAMDAANLSLATGGEVTTETARRMGLYVVGQLALRHDVTVRLRRNDDDGNGTVVTVVLPATVLSTGRPAPTAAPAPVAETSDEDAQAPTTGTTAFGLPTRPRVTTLSQVPSLKRPDEGSRTDGLTAARSAATPTALPEVGQGLPQRQPGANLPGSAPGVAPTTAPGASPADLPAATASGLPRRQPGVSVAGSPLAGAGAAPLPPRRPSWADAPAAGPATGPMPTAIPPRPKVDSDGTVEPPPGEFTPAPSSQDFDFVASLEPAPVDDLPVFKNMQSSWLSEHESDDLPWGSEEIDRGWEAAERAQSAPTAGTSRSGLPMRRPGSTLVPGQAGATPAAAVVRDPEAIRARLNRHRAGVQRGRSSTTTDSRATTGSVLLDEEINRP